MLALRGWCPAAVGGGRPTGGACEPGADRRCSGVGGRAAGQPRDPVERLDAIPEPTWPGLRTPGKCGAQPRHDLAVGLATATPPRTIEVLSLGDRGRAWPSCSGGHHPVTSAGGPLTAPAGPACGPLTRREGRPRDNVPRLRPLAPAGGRRSFANQTALLELRPTTPRPTASTHRAVAPPCLRPCSELGIGGGSARGPVAHPPTTSSCTNACPASATVVLTLSNNLRLAPWISNHRCWIRARTRLLRSTALRPLR